MSRNFCSLLMRVFILFLFAIGIVGVFSETASAATVTLAPTSGVAGQTVIITGSAFDNASAATITWDGVALTTTPASVTTSGAGAIPASGNVSFVVPSGAYGAHTVMITTGTSIVGVATFTINTPAVAVTSPTIPTAGIAPGVNLTVMATNMESSEDVVFYFDETIVGTVTASVGGGAVLTFPIPTAQNAGLHTVRAVSSSYATANVAVVIATAALTVNPATGSIGTKITATGTNFLANGAVSFTINGSTLTPDSSVTANGAGSFAASFTIPDLALGANSVKAMSDNNIYAVATFTAATPVLTLSPATGTAGLKVSVSGTGFRADSTVKFYVDDHEIDETASTNSIGFFRESIKIPDNIPVGVITIRAQTDSINFDDSAYTVITSTVTAAPVAGVPGTQVTLSGINFDPKKEVTIKWNGEAIKTSPTTLKTSSNGSFIAKIIIPDDFVSGNGQIESYTSNSSRVLTAFTIAAPTLALAPTSGLPGGRVTVTGANFVGQKKLTLLWDDQKISTSPLSVITTPLGGFVAVITVPESSRGVHSVFATTDDKINFSTSFTVTGPSITSSVTSTQANTKVIVSGTGFLVGKPVKFSWDNDHEIGTDPVTVIADESGFFSATVSIPENVTPGSHILRAFTNDIVSTTTTITISTGSISLSKDNGSPRDTVQITGFSFDAGKPVTFLWDGASFETPVVQTDDIGGFMATLTLPASSSGMHSIKVMTSEFAAVTEDFGINAPTLSTNPDAGRPREAITISGMNFVAGRKVIVTVNDREVNTEGEAMTDGSGNFTTSIKLPFTFADSVRIGVRTGSEDQQIAELSVTQWSVIQTIKKYGEWGAKAVFALVIIFLLLKFNILQRICAFTKEIFSRTVSS